MPNEESLSRERIELIEELVRRTESLSDPKVKALVVELVQAVMELHASGLDRMLEIIAATGDPGLALIDSIGADELAGSLLLLHGLHPEDLDTRLNRAIGKLNLSLGSRGASVSLESAQDDLIRLRFDGGRSRSNLSLKASIEQAIYAAAPEVGNVIVEGFEEPVAQDFVPVGHLLAGRGV